MRGQVNSSSRRVFVPYRSLPYLPGRVGDFTGGRLKLIPRAGLQLASVSPNGVRGSWRDSDAEGGITAAMPGDAIPLIGVLFEIFVMGTALIPPPAETPRPAGA